MNNLYYNQKYTTPKSQVPNATFKQIMNETFGKLFTWNARSTRKTFWTGIIASFIIEMIISVFWMTISFKNYMRFRPGTFYGGFRPNFGNIAPSFYIIGAIVFTLFLYLFFCQLGLMVRRLHDINVSGWWLWLSVIPTAGWVILFLGTIFPTIEKPVKWNHYLSVTKR